MSSTPAHPVRPCDAGVVATGASPHATLRPVPIHAVTLRDGFWRPRLRANRERGIPRFLAWLDRDDQTAPFSAFSQNVQWVDADSQIDVALSALKRNYEGLNANRLRHDWRGNVLKWLEACAYTIQSDNDGKIRELLDQFCSG